MSTLKVDNIRHNNATSDAITMASDGTCSAKLTSVGGGQLSHRNVLINGAMNISQRYTSSTSHPAYGADRWRFGFGNHSAGTVTASQQSLSSSDTPYTLGFRKYIRLALGQAGTAAPNTFLNLRYKVEAQDIAQCGWNYTSSSSFITLSFWIKSSVAQEFQITLVSVDGSSYVYPTETPSLSTNTWTKVTKTIPGNSNLSFDNDNGEGLRLIFVAYCGSDYSTDSATENAWNAYSSGNQFGRASTSTWYETNDATLEITGVQFEVGSQATAFEHRSFGEERQLCKRYFQRAGGAHWGATEGSTNYRLQIQLEPEMRASPTVTVRSGGVFNTRYQGSDVAITDPTKGTTAIKSRYIWTSVTSSGLTGGKVLFGRSANANADYLDCDAEL